MSRNPNPGLLANVSYYLAVISAFLILPAFFPPLGPVRQIFWLATITSAIGTFLGFTARADLKKAEPPLEEPLRRANAGFRLNLLIFVVMVVMTVLLIVGMLTGMIAR